jgi:hypothetical protein
MWSNETGSPGFSHACSDFHFLAQLSRVMDVSEFDDCCLHQAGGQDILDVSYRTSKFLSVSRLNWRESNGFRGLVSSYSSLSTQIRHEIDGSATARFLLQFASWLFSLKTFATSLNSFSRSLLDSRITQHQKSIQHWYCCRRTSSVRLFPGLYGNSGLMLSVVF